MRSAQKGIVYIEPEDIRRDPALVLLSLAAVTEKGEIHA
jgi:hypothetical protein